MRTRREEAIGQLLAAQKDAGCRWNIGGRVVERVNWKPGAGGIVGVASV